MTGRRILALVALACVALAATACGGATSSATSATASSSVKEDATVHTERTTTIDVAAGEAFTIQLPINPSTGYRWEADKPPTWTLVSHEILKPASSGDLVGQPSTEQWVYSVDAAGASTIDFSLFAPGGTAPEKSVTFSVTAR
jgi:inhibitor of cysteine peptidase